MKNLVAIIPTIMLVFLFLNRDRFSRDVPEGGSERIKSFVSDQTLAWTGLAKKFGNKFSIPPSLILAIIQNESGGDPGAIGSSGERGLMQVKKAAAQDVGERFEDQFDPLVSIRTGTKYIDLMIRNTGEIFQGLRAYKEGATGKDADKVRSARATAYANRVIETMNAISLII